MSIQVSVICETQSLSLFRLRFKLLTVVNIEIPVIWVV